MTLLLPSPYALVNLFFYIATLEGGLDTSHRRGETIKQIQKLEQLDKLKSYHNGSIVLFYGFHNAAVERLQQTLIRANNQIKKYNFKLRKLDCKKFVNVRECSSVDEALVYAFKRGEQTAFEESDLNGTDQTINQLLFFMASAHYDKMVDCKNMAQVKEILAVNSGVVNTVLGSFHRKDSEYLRRYLEVTMDTNDMEFAFILMSGNQVDRSMYNRNGFFIRFYYTLRPVEGDEEKFIDISDSARTIALLRSSIVTLNLGDEMHVHKKMIKEAEERSRNARKEQEEMQARIKAEAISELHRKVDSHQEKVSRLLSDKDREMTERVGVDMHISEIAADAYKVYKKQNHKDRSGYLLNENELRVFILRTEQTADQILLVLFYLPWDPMFQVFEQDYQTLSDKYKADPNVNIFQFDCYAWLRICEEYRILTFPKLLLFRNGINPIEYKDLLHTGTIAKYITLWRDAFLPVLTDMRQVKGIVKAMTSMFVLGVFYNTSDVIDFRRTQFESVSLQCYGRIRIGVVAVQNNVFEFNNENYQLPIVLAIHSNGVRQRIAATKEFKENELAYWIEDQKRSQVEQLTYSSFPSLFTLKKPFLISLQDARKDLSSLHKFAKRFPEVITVWMDTQCPLTQHIMETYELYSNVSIVILDKVHNKVFKFKQAKKTIGSVSKWVKDCLVHMNESAAHLLPNFEEEVHEGYDFLNKTDHLLPKLKEEAYEAVDGKTKKLSRLGSNKKDSLLASDVEEIEEDNEEDNEQFNYDAVKYREHDEL